MTPSAANGTKPKTKRPITIYDCSPDQKIECDYKYLARVWFFRTLAVVIVSSVTVLGGIIWNGGIWKTQQENEISNIKGTIELNSQLFDARLKKVEAMGSNIDSIKAWIRPK